ncbi:MAG: TRAM domain-containing protein [Ferruginibacter sp.]
MRKKKNRIVLTDILITDYAAEGKAIGRFEGKVIFTAGAVPGDTADLLLTKNKKDWAEARVLRIGLPSPDRVDPFCPHFGVCGGCKWQMLPYEKQLQYKQQEAEQNLRRIGKITNAEFLPIAGAEEQVYYRNKLEFTFSNKEFIPAPPPPEGGSYTDDVQIPFPPRAERGAGALGYHVPRIFDKTIDIFQCFLMDEVNNRIRNTVRDIAKENDFPFYDIKEHTGWLRNIILRYCTTG